MLSDYGSSALRPALGLLLLFVVSLAITWSVGGAEVGDTSAMVGWQRRLLDSGWWGSLLRALLLTSQATFNPLSIFGVKGLVIAKFPWLALWLWLNSVFSGLLFALFFLAVRRRFKMQ
jgi:hypothetical protein